MDRRNLNELRTVAELKAYRDQIRERLTELNREFLGLPLPEEERGEFGGLAEELKEVDRRIVELDARASYMDKIMQEPSAQETHTDRSGLGVELGFRVGSRVSDPYDLSDVRIDPARPERAIGQLRERAMMAADQAVYPGADSARAKERIEWLLTTADSEHGELARRILLTGAPVYQRAFGKVIGGRELSNEERTALATLPSSGQLGGYAVPFQLDPTVILTSDGVVNPMRAVARVESITSNEWRGVTSAGITVARAQEATEASDNAPTLAQPAVIPDRVQGFVPFSIEIGQDWGGLQSEITRMLQDAKDVEESAAFLTQNGTPPQSEGLLYALDNPDDDTSIVDTATIATFAIGDVYALMGALPPRWRSRATWMANLVNINRIRAFDAYGTLFTNLGEGTPERLLGRPLYEASAMDSTAAANDQILLFGDFSQYIIVDRVGMNVEVIPHLFGGSNNYPTGQRGFYALWRNRGEVITEGAFRLLEVKAS